MKKGKFQSVIKKHTKRIKNEGKNDGIYHMHSTILQFFFFFYFSAGAVEKTK